MCKVRSVQLLLVLGALIAISALAGQYSPPKVVVLNGTAEERSLDPFERHDWNFAQQKTWRLDRIETPQPTVAHPWKAKFRADNCILNFTCTPLEAEQVKILRALEVAQTYRFAQTRLRAGETVYLHLMPIPERRD